MKIQLIEHDPEDFSRTNVSFWAAKKGHRINQTYICNNEELPAVDSFDWLMVMGGTQHAWDESKHAWLRAEKAFLKEALAADKIILGICLGAQLLAQALGGRTFSNMHQETGWHEVVLNRQGKASCLFENIPPAFVTFHWHSDHFSLPPACTALASSKATQNQAFVCNGRPLVGLQFHPEYTREMVRYYARRPDQRWIAGKYVSSNDEVLARTDQIPDTYWLMEKLLDNMEREFSDTV